MLEVPKFWNQTNIREHGFEVPSLNGLYNHVLDIGEPDDSGGISRTTIVVAAVVTGTIVYGHKSLPDIPVFLQELS